MHFEFRRIEERRALALGIDAEHATVVSGADENRSVRRGCHGPEKRCRRLIHQLCCRAEDKLSVSVDRQVLDFTLEEVGLRGGLEEFWCRCARHGGGADEKRRDDQASSRRRDCKHVLNDSRKVKTRDLIRGNLNRQRPYATDHVIGGEFPFANRGAAQWVETPAAPVGFEHRED